MVWYSSFLLNFLEKIFHSCFFSLNLYKSKENETYTCEKENNKNNSKANILTLFLTKVHEINPS